MKNKTVSFSETTITELMIPSYANFSGKIHGGILNIRNNKRHSKDLKKK